MRQLNENRLYFLFTYIYIYITYISAQTREYGEEQKGKQYISTRFCLFFCHTLYNPLRPSYIENRRRRSSAISILSLIYIYVCIVLTVASSQWTVSSIKLWSCTASHYIRQTGTRIFTRPAAQHHATGTSGISFIGFFLLTFFRRPDP